MKEIILNFIQFSELEKLPLKNKKALFFSTFLKAFIIMAFFVIIYVEGDFSETWRFLFIFDVLVILLGIFLGVKISAVEVSFANVVDVLYAVWGRFFAAMALLYILLEILAKVFLETKLEFWGGGVGVHLLFGALFLLLLPRAFLKLRE